ncbi:MAG: class I SAM-dependent methyltransferase [Saprospirales bacterium]|nr:class I SAM-dependent methyltransferase [Saprospirales bacterium]MBK8489743.1 class I SAM-dependent methyltransferase [Saprospirales bacterium]
MRTIFYSLPSSWRFLARRLYYLPTDWWELAAGKRAPLQPPKGLIYTGGGDFLKEGSRLLERFVRIGGLQPHHQVLDIGSGIGRVAIPMTPYLNKRGFYEGFDVVELGVRWCQEHISRRFPNFQFQYVPLANDLYRKDGTDAATFHFPYGENQFDFVIANSVFTHMLPKEVDNYLKEIQRVLKPGGKCYATFFILNAASISLMAEQPDFQFRHDHGHYRLFDEKVKAANVAFEEDYLIRELLNANQLKAVETHYGYWCGRNKEACEDFQDFVLVEKLKSL